MNEEYNLVYYHKITNKRVLVKSVTRLDFIGYDETTNSKFYISQWSLRHNYISDKDNSKRQKRVRLEFKKRSA